MAAENEATFTEVLSITADQQAFEQSLATLKDAYTKWLSSLGEGANSNFAGAGIAQMLSDMVKSLDEFTTRTSLAVESFVSAFQAANVKVVESSNEATETQVKNTQAVSDANIKLAQDISIEQEGIATDTQESTRKRELMYQGMFDSIIAGEQKVAEGQQKFAQDLAVEQEGVATATSESVRKQELMYQGMFDSIIAGEEKIAAAQKKLAEEISNEQEGVVNAELEALRKRQAAYDEMFAKILAAEARISAAQKASAENINIEQEGVVNAAAEKQAKLQEQFNAELEKTAALKDKLATLSLGNNLPAQIQKITADLEVLQAKIESLNAKGVGQGAGAASQESLAELKNYNDLLTQQKGLISDLTSAQNKLTAETNRTEKANQGIFDNLFENIPKSIAQLAAFQVEWAAISAITNGITAVIEAPFKAIADGVKYLRDTENAAASLVGPLQANVQFSSDLVENFKASTDAANQVERALQGVATKANIPVEQLRDVFKAVVESGGQNAGKTLQDTIDLATTLALTYKAQGAEAVNNNRLLQQTRQLFEGGLVPSSSLFLQTTGQTVQQYQDMIAAGLENHDLLQRLPDIINQTTSGLRVQQDTQEAITKQIELQIKQLEGGVAEQFYKDITDQLKSFSAALKENTPFLQEFLKVFADLVLAVANAVKALASLPGVSTLFKAGLLGIEVAVDRLRSSITETVAGIKLLAEQVAHPFDVAANKKAMEDYVTTVAQSLKTTANLYSVVYNGGVPPSSTNSSGNQASPLNQPVIAKPHAIPPISDLVERTEELRRDKLAFQQQLDDIKQRYEKFQQAMAEAESSGTANKRDVSNDFNLHLQDQIDAVNQALATFKEAANSDSIKVANDPTLTIEQRKRVQADINLSIQQEAKKTQEVIDALRAEGIRLDAAANREELQARVDAYNKDLTLLKQALSERLAAIRQAATDGRLTEVEAIDQEEEARKAAYEAERQRMDYALNQQDLGFKEHQKIIEARTALDAAYTAANKQYTDVRADALYREQLAQEAFADKSRELTLQQQALTAELNALEYGDTGYSAAQQQLLTAHELELHALEQEKAAQLEVAIAKNANTQATRDLMLQLRQLSVEQQQAYNSRIQQIRGQVSNPTFQRQLIQGANANEEARLTIAQRQAQDNFNEFRTGFSSQGLDTDQINAKFKVLAIQLDQANRALKQFEDGAKASPISELKAALEKTFFGAGFFTTFKKNQDAIDASTDSASRHAAELNQAVTITAGVSNAFVGLVGIINKVQQGLAQGGILGGAGAAASEAGGILGSLSDISGIGKAIPVVGSVLSAIGPVLSFVGNLFTAQARRIGEEIKKSFSDTVTAFQNGNTDLADTIISLEQQRQSAIARLSGKKGGQDQLNSLLPQFDQEIASLKKQQEDLITSFETQLASLQQQSTTLSTISTQWASINKQVKDYLAAGGDAVKAAQFLSLSLQSIQQNAQQSLDQGEQTAIQDATNLNNLLQQRIDLQKTMKQAADAFAKSQFDLINADSLERKQAGSVSRGQQIADAQAAYDAQTKAYQDQLTALDSQIGFEQTKVDKEAAIFGLVTDTTNLQQEQNRLNLKALDDQIQKWTDLKSIVSGITMGPDGNFAGSGVTAPVNNNFYINITGSNLTPQQVQDSVSAALDQAARQGSPY